MRIRFSRPAFSRMADFQILRPSLESERPGVRYRRLLKNADWRHWPHLLAPMAIFAAMTADRKPARDPSALRPLHQGTKESFQLGIGNHMANLPQSSPAPIPPTSDLCHRPSNPCPPTPDLRPPTPVPRPLIFSSFSLSGFAGRIRFSYWKGK